MTPVEYAELVEWITTHWGPSEAWMHADRLVADFEVLDADSVWESVKARITGHPEQAVWPPKPAELMASSTQRMRAQELFAEPVPAPVAQLARPPIENYGWAEYSMRTYGEVIRLREAVERAWKQSDAG